MSIRPLPLLAFFAVSACATDAVERRAPTVRDSAGIRIVESTAPQWKEGEAWHLGEEPRVVIGNGDTDETQLFGVQGAVKLSNGTFVIANSGSFELRYYDSSGAFLRASGGEGKGPGEFSRGPWALWKRPGDTLAATDPTNFRLSYYDARGNFAGAVTLRPEPRKFPRILGQLDDAQLVTWDGVYRQYSGPEKSAFRDSSLYQIVSSDGARFEDVALLPASERWTYTWLGRTNQQALPFGRTGRAAVATDGFWYTTAEHFEIIEFAPSRGMVSIVRLLAQPPTLKDDDISSYKAERMASAPDDPTGRRSWRRWLDDAPYPATSPTFQSLLVDEEQYIWAELFKLPGSLLPPDYASEWMLFDSDGRFYGTVVMPQRFTPYSIGSDYVLGVWRNADDVEHVQLYDLIKPEND